MPRHSIHKFISTTQITAFSFSPFFFFVVDLTLIVIDCQYADIISIGSPSQFITSNYHKQGNTWKFADISFSFLLVDVSFDRKFVQSVIMRGKLKEKKNHTMRRDSYWPIVWRGANFTRAFDTKVHDAYFEEPIQNGRPAAMSHKCNPTASSFAWFSASSKGTSI